MEYITLKNSDLRVSRLCMGGCPMGGYGWGSVEEQELLDTVNTALDQGINFFDTADSELLCLFVISNVAESTADYCAKS